MKTPLFIKLVFLSSALGMLFITGGYFLDGYRGWEHVEQLRRDSVEHAQRKEQGKDFKKQAREKAKLQVKVPKP